MKTLFVCCSLVTSMILLPVAHAQEANVTAGATPTETPASGDELFDLDLEALMEVRVDTATLTGISYSKSPTSMTTISARDIAVTPARNIYDLLEVYVPGAHYMLHTEGVHPGIRGIISDRDLKMLLLVNGKNMNQSAHNGAIAELGNWDLNDIERIDVIRGPGSVTYGPGAVAGVISITTKSTKTESGSKTAAFYNFPYKSTGVNFSKALKNDSYEFFGYGSFTRTEGERVDTYAVDNSGNVGYVGKDFSSPSSFEHETTPLFGDFRNDPQVKVFLEFKTSPEWKFWARYTNLGTSLPLTLQSAAARVPNSNGDLEDFKGFWSKHAIVAAENERKLSDTTVLKSMVSLSSQDYARTENQYYDPHFSNVRNFRARFAENEIFVRSLAVSQFGDKNKSALGVEISRKDWGPGWGDNRKHFRMGDNDEIVADGNSPAIDPGLGSYNGAGPLSPGAAIKVGDGWHAYLYSLLGETNFEIGERHTFLASGRLDKHTYSDRLFSPRFAWISEVGDNSHLKFIWQQSRRLNTDEQLMVQDHKGNSRPDPEKLTGYEIIYNTLYKKNLLVNVATFYNDIEVLGFDSATFATVKKGDLKLYGVELEAKYTAPRYTAGLSHSLIKQIEFELGSGQSFSGISYSDFTRTISGVTLKGEGNDINNWPNQSTKVFFNYQQSEKWSWHTNARLFWDYKGALDGLKMAQRDNAGTGTETTTNNVVNKLRDKSAYQANFFWDISTEYKFTPNLSLSGYLINILGTGRHYSYDIGYARAWPNRVAFTEEPQSVAMMLKYTH